MGNIGPPASTDTTPRSQKLDVTRASAGTHYLCLEVDNKGANTNRAPIQMQEFKATVVATPATAGRPVKKMEGVIGQIKRNGTAVNIPYLTVASNYNQRLIIVNRGPTAATYELGNFTTEPGAGVKEGLGPPFLCPQPSCRRGDACVVPTRARQLGPRKHHQVPSARVS